MASLAKAETGVSTSATTSAMSGTRLPPLASWRNSSSEGVTVMAVAVLTTNGHEWTRIVQTGGERTRLACWFRRPRRNLAASKFAGGAPAAREARALPRVLGLVAENIPFAGSLAAHYFPPLLTRV